MKEEQERERERERERNHLTQINPYRGATKTASYTEPWRTCTNVSVVRCIIRRAVARRSGSTTASVRALARGGAHSL